MPALSETRMGVVVTRIFHSNPRHSITLHSSTVYRDEMQFSSGQDSREFWIDRGLRLFKVYLHPRIIGRRTSFVSISLFLLFFSRNEIIPPLSVCTGVSSPFPRNDIITRWDLLSQPRAPGLINAVH